MATITLKESDTIRMRNLNAKNEYGLNIAQMIRLINDYQKAKKEGNDYKCALIEYRLTDINFHHEVDLLQAGKYNELIQEVKQW